MPMALDTEGVTAEVEPEVSSPLGAALNNIKRARAFANAARLIEVTAAAAEAAASASGAEISEGLSQSELDALAVSEVAEEMLPVSGQGEVLARLRRLRAFGSKEAAQAFAAAAVASEVSATTSAAEPDEGGFLQASLDAMAVFESVDPDADGTSPNTEDGEEALLLRVRRVRAFDGLEAARALAAELLGEEVAEVAADCEASAKTEEAELPAAAEEGAYEGYVPLREAPLKSMLLLERLSVDQCSDVGSSPRSPAAQLEVATPQRKRLRAKQLAAASLRESGIAAEF